MRRAPILKSGEPMINDKGVERVFNVAGWTEMPVGGHFAALEQPRALARDIHEAFAAFR